MSILGKFLLWFFLGHTFALIPRKWLVKDSEKPLVPGYDNKAQLHGQVSQVRWFKISWSKIVCLFCNARARLKRLSFNLRYLVPLSLFYRCSNFVRDTRQLWNIVAVSVSDRPPFSRRNTSFWNFPLKLCALCLFWMGINIFSDKCCSHIII